MRDPLYLIAGLGKTGQSIARYLKRRNQIFVGFDTRENSPDAQAFSQAFPGVELFLGHIPDSLYGQLTEIVTSPGVPLDNPFIQRAMQQSIPLVGDIEYFAREINAPVIAITGTNGKSTVTTLVGEMVSAGMAKKPVAVAGNIGTPVLDLVDDGQDYAAWVLELSSFQLDLTSSLTPIAATVLNISPDHLDRHQGLQGYIAAKHRIFKNAKTLLYNRDDLQTKPLMTESRVLTSFGLSQPSDLTQWGLISEGHDVFLAYGKEPLIHVDDLKIKGKHNWQNALAAAALATVIGIDKLTICAVLKSFSGLPHRCQWVRTLNGVVWINDSKGTNVGATISAISGIGAAIKGQIVLIAGGLGKGADFCDLRETVKEYVQSVIVIGTDAPKIEQSLADLVPVIHATSFPDAIFCAHHHAKAGDVVLLSPACASLDMFQDFNHRGNLFTELVMKL